MWVAKPREQDCLFRERMMFADEKGNAFQFLNTHLVCVTKTLIWVKPDFVIPLTEIRQFELYKFSGLPNRVGIEITYYVARLDILAQVRLCFHVFDFHRSEKPKRLKQVLEQACAEPDIRMGRLLSEDRQRHAVKERPVTVWDGLFGRKMALGLKILNQMNRAINHRLDDLDDFEQALVRYRFLLQTHAIQDRVPSLDALRHEVFRYILLVRAEVYGPWVMRFVLPLVVVGFAMLCSGLEGGPMEHWPYFSFIALLAGSFFHYLVPLYATYGMRCIQNYLGLEPVSLKMDRDLTQSEADEPIP